MEEGVGNQDYKEVMRLCREKIRKPQLECNLGTALKHNKRLL